MMAPRPRPSRLEFDLTLTTRKYDAIAFDLLTALLDSWSLWESVAGSRSAAMAWRAAYLRLTYGTGEYRAYETLVQESAAHVGLPARMADDLVERWDELPPWIGVREALVEWSASYRLALVTNCSEALARRAADRVGSGLVLVSAERAGFYKPHATPYRMALAELGTAPERTLFVAGSPFDILGAGRVGMPVFWHNQIGMARPEAIPAPLAESRDVAGVSAFLAAARA